jgi:malate-CoA ligase subunit beta
LKVPLIVRLAGTNVGAGRKILDESGIDVITANSLGDAAAKAVEAARSHHAQKA